MTFKNLFIEASRQALLERTTSPGLENDAPEGQVYSNSDTLVIYHGNCADGFCAAALFWQQFGPFTTYHHGVYGEAPPDCMGKMVYIVDFSYAPDVMHKIISEARHVTWLDHHKSAIENMTDRLEGYYKNFSYVLDMSRSGAMIAWDFLHNTSLPEGLKRDKITTFEKDSIAYKEAPLVVQYVQDRDLWTKKLPYIDEVSAYLFSLEYDFAEWSRVINKADGAGDLNRMAAMGGTILKKQKKDIAELIKLCKRTMWIGGECVPVCNMPYMFASEACQDMLTAHLEAKFVACYWDTAEHRIFSLRSNDSRMDVSEIAQLYGGGGHRNAAGFKVNRQHILAIG